MSRRTRTALLAVAVFAALAPVASAAGYLLSISSYPNGRTRVTCPNGTAPVVTSPSAYSREVKCQAGQYGPPGEPQVSIFDGDTALAICAASGGVLTAVPIDGAPYLLRLECN